MGRATQGVKLINLKGSDSIAAVAKVMKEDEDEINSESTDIEDVNKDGTTLDINEEE
jgi:DNA gyrase subunit A